MQAMTKLLKHFVSVPLKFWGTARQAKASSGRGQRASRTFRPGIEVLEDRLVPSSMPAAPVFSATAVSGSQVDLSWNRVANASGYLVDEYILGAWRQVANLSSGSTSYMVAGLSAGMTYDFDVAAYNSAGTHWANGQAVTTKSSAPAAPSFSAQAVSSSQVNLSWNRVANASGYLVDEWTGSGWRLIASLASSSTSYAVGGLSAGTTYSFDVGAYNSAGTSWANSQSVTTRANTVTINHPAAAGPYEPVSGSLFGPNGPSYLDVEQGNLGDCWLMASLAEVAAREPSVIRSMFTYEGTAVENGATVGLYSVRLYSTSGSAFSVTVDTELPDGGSLYDHPANGVLWVALAEKAYAEGNGERLVTTNYEGSDSYAALNYGDAAWALHAITGQSVKDYSINPSNVASAWNTGELIVLCTSNPPNPYIVPNHCYAVVNYNASSTTPFEMYNPWGTNSSGWALGTYNNHPVYGLFGASAAALAQNFTTQSIAASPAGVPASMDGTSGAAFVQLDLERSLPSAAFPMAGMGSPAQTPPGTTDGMLLPASVTPEPDRLGSDALWTDVGNPDSPADFLGQPSLQASGWPL